jgi:hypothetical protein
VVVEPRRAGETIVCSCGESLQVPTMLEMAALEPAPPEPVAPSSGPAWNWRQGMLLLGGFFVLAAIVIGAVVYHWDRPIPQADQISPEQFRAMAGKLTPTQTWAVWESMKQGLDRRTDIQYEILLAHYHGLLSIDAVLALIGIALIAVGIWKTGRQGDRETRR